MKVRDYLHLIKWLDNEPMHGKNEISRFILRLNISNAGGFVVSGGWKDCIAGNEIGTINIKPEYLYLLEFSVMKDQWHVDSWCMGEDNKPMELRSCVMLDIVPQSFLSGDVRIPQELMNNIIMDAYHTGEDDTYKRNSSGLFGFLK